MGIFDTIRAVLGTSAETDATREADPEDLFGMSTAYLTMQADLGYDHCGEAALCFSGMDSTRFDDAVESELLGVRTRTPATPIRCDQLARVLEVGEKRVPVVVGGRRAVEEHQRLALAVRFVPDGRSVRGSCGLHGTSCASKRSALKPALNCMVLY